MLKVNDTYYSDIFTKARDKTFKPDISIGGSKYGSTQIVKFKLNEIAGAEDTLNVGTSALSMLEIHLYDEAANKNFFKGLEVSLALNAFINGYSYTVKLGTYTVDKAKREGNTIVLTCYSDMKKLDKPYFSDLVYPAATKDVIQEISTKSGIKVSNKTPYNTTITEKPEGYTYRQFLGIIAAYNAGFVSADKETADTVNIKSFGDTGRSIPPTGYPNFKHSENPTQITKVLYDGKQVGTQGYGIALELPSATDEQLNLILNELKKISYYATDLGYIGDPTLEAGDIIQVKGKDGLYYPIVIMEHEISYDGGLKGVIKSKARDEAEQETANNIRKGGKEIADLAIKIANIDKALINYATIGYLEADSGYIATLQSKFATITSLVTQKAEIEQALIKKADITELTSQKAEILDLTVSKADINILLADLATIEQLYSEKAIIEDLISERATIKDLTANYATIASLNAVETTTGRLLAGKADISVLEAVNANIITLQGDSARFNNLFAGNITASNLKTGLITADSGLIANGAIKDAMILDLSANKISAGTIFTNKVSIQNQDGSLSLAGSLLRMWDDKNRERISLGKDSTGNFTIKVRGVDGQTVMLDETGVKNAGITDGAINDSKVMANANIQGSKLDIKSVVTEINNGTTTLKSSKILFDDTGQTLSVAFKELNTYARDIKVGGRNLIKGTSSEWKIFNMIEGVWYYDMFTGVEAKAGETYTFSIEVEKVSEDTVPINITLGLGTTERNYVWDFVYANKYGIPFGKKTSITVTVKEADLVSGRKYLAWRFRNEKKATTIRYRCLKLETGTLATDYTPAPEDTDKQISDIDSKIQNVNTSLTVEKGRITTLISEQTLIKGSTDTNTSKLSTLEQDLNSFKTTITSQYDTKEAASGKYSTKQEFATLELDLKGFKTAITETIGNTDKTVSDLSTKSSSLEQQVNGFKLTVSEVDQKVVEAFGGTVIKQSDNLINPAVVTNYGFSGGKWTSGVQFRGGYVAVEPNTKYTLSRTGGNRFMYALTTSVVSVGGTVTGIVDKGDVNTAEFNSGVYKYLYFTFADNASEDSVQTTEVSQFMYNHNCGFENGKLVENDKYKGYVIMLQHDTDYTVTKTAGNAFKYALTTVELTPGDTVTVRENSTNVLKFNSGKNEYIYICMGEPKETQAGKSVSPTTVLAGKEIVYPDTFGDNGGYKVCIWKLLSGVTYTITANSVTSYKIADSYVTEGVIPTLKTIFNKTEQYTPSKDQYLYVSVSSTANPTITDGGTPATPAPTVSATATRSQKTNVPGNKVTVTPSLTKEIEVQEGGKFATTATVSALEQTLNTFRQTVSSTYETKDNAGKVYSTKAALSELEQNLEGFKLTAKDTYATNAELSAKYSTLETGLNGFKTEVSNIYSTKEDLNNLKIGGRNLLLNSANILLMNSDSGNVDLSKKVDDYISFTPIRNGSIFTRTDLKSSVILKKGERYTLSFEIKTEVPIKLLWNVGGVDTPTIEPTNGKFVRFSYTYTQLLSDFQGSCFWGFKDVITGKEVQYKLLKLENGETSTEWTPAPEDLVFLSQFSTLKQDYEGFKSTVGSTYETKNEVSSKISTLTQSLDGFKSDVSKTYITSADAGNKYTLKTDFTKLETTLNSFKSDVGSTYITKNEAGNYVLKSAYSTLEQDLNGFKTTVRDTYMTGGDVELIAKSGINLIDRVAEQKNMDLAKPDTRYCTSDFIPVKPSTKYMLSIPELAGAPFLYGSWKFYKADKTQIYTTTSDGMTRGGESVMTTYPAAAFIRISYLNNSTPKFEIGEVATPFTLSPRDLVESIKNLSNDLTVVEQTKNSYAIKVITDRTKILSELNLTGGTAKINASLIELNGYTTITSGFAQKLDVNDLSGDKAKFGSVIAKSIDVNDLTGNKAKFAEALFNAPGSSTRLDSKGLGVKGDFFYGADNMLGLGSLYTTELHSNGIGFTVDGSEIANIRCFGSDTPRKSNIYVQANNVLLAAGPRGTGAILDLQTDNVTLYTTDRGILFGPNRPMDISCPNDIVFTVGTKRISITEIIARL